MKDVNQIINKTKFIITFLIEKIVKNYVYY